MRLSERIIVFNFSYKIMKHLPLVASVIYNGHLYSGHKYTSIHKTAHFIISCGYYNTQQPGRVLIIINAQQSENVVEFR